MHKFFVTAILALSTLVATPTISLAATAASGHHCTLPNSRYIEGVGCVYVISDPAELATQIDTATGKPIQVRIQQDPHCDGKPSGYEYQIATTDPKTGIKGQTTYRCD